MADSETGRTRWNVLYTTQKSQKRKKFHDGCIVLRITGALRKAFLYDNDSKPLEEKILKRSEVIEDGAEIDFDRYLVEVTTTDQNNGKLGGDSKRQKPRSIPQILERLKKPGASVPQPNAKQSKTILEKLPSAKLVDSKELLVPVRLKFQVGASQLSRQVIIPSTFHSLASYKRIMSAAVVEEINLTISEFANKFSVARKTMKSGHQSVEEMEQSLASHGIMLYGNCELFSRPQCRSSNDSQVVDGFHTIYLKLGRSTGPLRHNKGDLWIINSDINFLSDDISIVAYSESYGSSNGPAVELMASGEKSVFKEGQNVYALRGPGILSGLSMLKVVRKLSQTPLLPLLLGSKPYVPTNPDSPLEDIIHTTILKYKLNEDQAKVVGMVGRWFTSKSSAEICLVHGPFGSGKSYLLVVLIMFLSNYLEMSNDRTTRIVVCGATNNAVDRVLSGLVEQGYQDFLRVGCLSKIARNILPYSIHAALKSDDISEAENDLVEILKESLGSERQTIENELQALRDGRMNRRKQMLKQVRVVGVTCMSSVNAALRGNHFKLCFMDESSQITEPLSLIPLTQFGCEKLVAVGDPNQLPPILAATTSAEADLHPNLSRSLFVRLTALGHKPILLRTQYRCHPGLTVVPNTLFYGGHLIDGCSESERAALVPNFPTLLFCDTSNHGTQTKNLSNSYSNTYEATVICSMIHSLLCKGIDASQIGVIVLYKDQENAIKRMLEQEARQVTASTVDAFQGMEKDIIFLSCCRTNGVGFMNCRERLNVALTRAKHHLILVGKASNLYHHNLWHQLLNHVQNLPNCLKKADEACRWLETADTPHPTKEEEGEEESAIMQKKLDAVNFSGKEFWEGYKCYCYAYYSKSIQHQNYFMNTRMGELIGEENMTWDLNMDVRVRSLLGFMEEYVQQRYGVDCTDIRFLMNAYDKEFAASDEAQLFLRLCQD